MGKLDYLAKYASSSGERKSKKSKKSTRKKSKKSKNIEELLVEDEDTIVSFPVCGDDVDDDEDRPVVVPLDDPGTPLETKNMKQEWTEVADGPDTPIDKENSSRRRKRYGYSNDEENDIDRSHPKRIRHDSDDDSDVLSNDHMPNRRRYDSEEGSINSRRRKDLDDSDSSSLNHDNRHVKGNDSDDIRQKRKHRRHDSDREVSFNDEKPHNRKRYDSESDTSSVQPRNCRRHSYSDDKDSGEERHRKSDRRRKRRKRNDSSGSSTSDEKGDSRRQRNDTDSDASEDASHDLSSPSENSKLNPNNNETLRERMSSGHVAGLQRASDFKGAEKEIQERKNKEAQDMVDKYGMGETVYRDELGRQVDDIKQKKLPKMDKVEQELLNKGRVQKEQELLFKQEWKSIQGSAFARHADDSNLEELRRNFVRDGDPMAKHVSKKEAKLSVSDKAERPIYKGPSAKPNRFGIRPGYRWDGVDRGNNFEDKVLQRKYSTESKKEAAYRWSTSDM
mmetsp:Transcript_15815/g.23280  ORF Transcript_15815/g.23280 Transcript_15815/m.23280 type:complete len:505 (-) Transcript_15815:252-1766(-)